MLSMNKVFVYGTLKRGGRWHFLLAESPCTRFLGQGKTRDRLPMIAQGVPFLFNAPGKGCRVKGEVFEVDDETLAALDRLEQHPHWYRRELTGIELAQGEVVRVWVYFAVAEPERALLRSALLAGDAQRFIDEYR
jgi:gamma-glutamylaminecyclotransferase